MSENISIKPEDVATIKASDLGEVRAPGTPPKEPAVLAEVELCDAAVDAFFAAIMEGRERPQAYRNAAYASHQVTQRMAKVRDGARRNRQADLLRKQLKELESPTEGKGGDA